MNVTAAASETPRNIDQRLFIGAAMGVALIVFIGFARSYYLRSLFGLPVLPLLVHAHGLLMTTWTVLFLTQTCLIAAQRVEWHRRLGVFGTVLAILIVAVGAVVTFQAAAGVVRAPPTHPPGFLVILGFNMVDLAIFAGLIGTAIALRRRGDYHKRLMLLATLSLLGQPLARVVSDSHAVLLLYLCVLICVAVDTFRNRRLHPVFAWGAPLIIVSLQLTYLAVLTPTWMQFARRLVS